MSPPGQANSPSPVPSPSPRMGRATSSQNPNEDRLKIMRYNSSYQNSTISIELNSQMNSNQSEFDFQIFLTSAFPFRIFRYGTLNRERRERLAANDAQLQKQKEELRKLGILDWLGTVSAKLLRYEFLHALSHFRGSISSTAFHSYFMHIIIACYAFQRLKISIRCSCLISLPCFFLTYK